MQSFILISDAGLEVLTTEKIDSDLITDVVETPYQECVNFRFSDPSITAYINETGRLEGLPAHLVFKRTGENLCGRVFICSSIEYENDFELIGLTHHQIEIIKNEIHVDRKGLKNLPSYPRVYTGTGGNEND